MLNRRKDVKLKCDCRNFTETVKLVAEAGCADDKAAVASLPVEWVPRKGGPRLTKFLKEREIKHENSLQEIKYSASKINDEIEAKVRTIAEILLHHIQKNEIEINCVVEQYTMYAVPLSPEARDEALKQARQFYSARVDDIAAFHREALVLERQRADGLRELLRKQFQCLVAIGHLPPKDLLHDFDQRTYEINQQLLSNSRAYAQLEAQLRAQMDEHFIQTRSSLNQLCLGVAIKRRRNSAQAWQPEEKPSVRRPTTAVIQKPRESSVSSIGKILKDVDEFDICVARMLEAYRDSVMKVYDGFSGKLHELHKHLGCHDYIEHEPLISEITDLYEMIEKVLCKLSSNLESEIIEITQTDTMSMQRSVWSLGESLRDTFVILHDAGHLWDAHMLRSGLAQKLTIAAVEDLLTNNDATELANEVLFNVALEQLLSISDVDKLQQIYDTIVSMIERTANMYMHHNAIELQRLEEFMNFPLLMATTLMAEFKCFLEKYPRNPVQSMGSLTSQRSMLSARLSPNSIKEPLSRAIFQTELQTQSLTNWRNGFLESFEINVNAVPDEMTHQAHLWVEEKAIALHTRYSSKMVSHSIRLEHLKAARDMRLAELRQHESRLDSHLGAIYDLVHRLPTIASEFLTLDSPKLYPFCKWTDSLHMNIFEESVHSAIDACKMQAQYRVQEARISNVRFLSQIKLFSEGGLYSAQEAIRTSASLMKGADALESCISRTVEALNHRRSLLLNLADNQLLPLQKMADDVLNIGKLQDKRKPTPVNRK